jgi:hypothetical protein
MPARFRVAIVSDIHYASAAEAARRNHTYAPITNPLRRWLTRQYRHWIWMRDPFAHNHLLDRFCSETSSADLAVANGDYSCDSAYIGLADEAAFQSARECLGKLRLTFGARLRATIGDHEIGKKMMAADCGSLRVASYQRAVDELLLEPFWKFETGRYVLLGVTSTLLALPIYESEALADEIPHWRRLRDAHFDQIRESFKALALTQKVLLFCHDPSALPFLWEDAMIRSRVAQIERTVIGHLHSPIIYKQSRYLSGMPAIGFLGHTPLRLSRALRAARYWKPFRPLLCPSVAGIQLRKDGGYYVAELDPSGGNPATFEFHPLAWDR